MPDGITGLHWAAYGGWFEIVKLLLARKAPLELRDGRHRATPLGWALHAWESAPPESSVYYDVVALLVASGASLGSALPVDPRHRSLLIEKMRADARMTAALGSEMPAQ